MKLFQGINYVAGSVFNRYKTYITYSLNYLNRKRDIDRNYMDRVRLASLELVAYEINKNNISGAVAELGVYKGKFARYINKYFKNRNIYLFDTFSGFDSKDIKAEVENTFSDGSQDFSNTSVRQVLSIMPFPDKCIIKQGYFPDTAIGINDEFVFVSIDADLFDPIYNGLVYFYPRLKKGGYIFIHDYNNDGYKGVREAVEKYCRENNLNIVPIPDAAGTAILVK